MSTARPPIGRKSAPAPVPREPEAPPPASRLLTVSAPSWMVSVALHFIAILLLGCMYIDLPKQVQAALLQAKIDQVEPIIEESPDVPIPLPIDVTTVSNTTSDFMRETVIASASVTPTEIMANDEEAATMQVELAEMGPQTASKADLMTPLGAANGNQYSGRGGPNQAKLAEIGGGSKASEAAVAAALQWLAEHQMPDGGWSFDHRGGACQGRCANAGDLKECRTGATAMALLPFLGAGQTHKVGKYRKNVEAGLYFLVSQMKVTGNRGDLAQGGGNMYAHGLGAITLTEAYAMTQDKGLLTPAQYALNHIVFAQDPAGGGWRYTPKQPGDTSVVGWQLMALKSGHLAYLNVPKETVAGANKFLDSVQSESGARYGYTAPGGNPGTTAVGLLCRMYLGWKKDHPGIERGVDYLSGVGPSKGNLYYNYYATQVMRHYDGDKWRKWNDVMRDQLVNSQDKQGHQAGSWFVGGDEHSTGHGGRLYCTSLSTMILEVYYRHLPIYGTPAADDFPS